MDSLVMDLIFKEGATPTPDQLITALGGEEYIAARKLIDPDMIDPRFEMTMAPSMPLRRRGERRLLIIDDSVAPLRADPEKSLSTTIDLRAEKERLIAVCATGMVRVGRLNGLGMWGDAVLVSDNARDLRGVALLSWALDPQVDIDGKRRANRLTQKEFEEKLLSFDKRMAELDEQAILQRLGPANFERRGNLLVVDVLENDGTWDLRKSIMLEEALASLDRFSMIPGAPQQPGEAQNGGKAAPRKAAAPTAPVKEPAKPDNRPPLKTAEINGHVFLIFPPERFDLDVVAAIGKKDWETVLSSKDALDGRQRDRIHSEGARFLAPLEFLSEVFYDGKPLTKVAFEEHAQTVGKVKTLEVHCPRFGTVLLLVHPERGRYISSELREISKVLELIS